MLVEIHNKRERERERESDMFVCLIILSFDISLHYQSLFEKKKFICKRGSRVVEGSKELQLGSRGPWFEFHRSQIVIYFPNPISIRSQANHRLD